MSGIYIHIPFCHQKCNYCNFHLSTCLNLKNEVLKAIVKEIKMQKEYLKNEALDTIYFGGGTPSLLSIKEIEDILKTIFLTFKISPTPEITLEANPIDLTEEKTCGLKAIGINRLSIGVQTFNETFLKFLNRQETSKNIYSAINNVVKYDFKNFNIDLIFAIPGQKKEDLMADIEKLIAIHPTHISTYCLTIEEKTVLDFWIKKGITKKVDDDLAADFFLIIDEILTSEGYEHYEISNYCLNGFKAIHNSNYWNGKMYLGVGPSAHSYNLISRQYNVENNLEYIKSIKNGKIPANVEILTEKDKTNEYIFTHLRTSNGINVRILDEKYKYQINEDFIEEMKKQNLITKNEDVLTLTTKGMLISDEIIKNLLL